MLSWCAAGGSGGAPGNPGRDRDTRDGLRPRHRRPRVLSGRWSHPGRGATREDLHLSRASIPAASSAASSPPDAS